MKKLILLILFIFLEDNLVVAQEDSIGLINDFLEIPRDSLLELEVEKNDEVLVTSASLFEENLAETPGVVTVITKEEIDRRGFRQLSEIFATIPGFFIAQNDDEKLITIRGIYNTTNQKYLLLRNGHRMNEGILDRITPFYAYSLESVKQIEIIRGGGSSLYGTGAMMAVINIVTNDKEAQSIKASVGNNGQLILEGLYHVNNPSSKTKISTFFRYANIKGENRFIPASEDYSIVNPRDANFIIDNYPHNMDLGIHIHHQKLHMHFTLRREDYGIFWTTYEESINSDSTLVRNAFLGMNYHGDIEYLTTYNNWNFTFQHYVDYADLKDDRSLAPNSEKYPFTRHFLFTLPSMRAGIDYQALYKKDKLSLLMGMLHETRYFPQGVAYDNTEDSLGIKLSNTPFTAESQEYRGGIYLQSKYNFNENWVANVGARFDYSDNFPASFNPRVALIYKPSQNYHFKFLYAKSFLAPAYLYRAVNSTVSEFTSKTLFPEIINTFQFVANKNFSKKGNIRVTYFMNLLTDLIRRIEGVNQNVGRISTHGVEVETDFQITDKLRIYGNYSMTLPLESIFGRNVSDSLYRARNVIDGRFRHIPTQQALLGLTCQFTKNISLNTYGNWIGAYQTSTAKRPEYQVNDIFLANATLSWRKIIQGLSASFTVTNLLDRQYKLGEINTQPLPQAGRWWTFSLFYDFR